ncbi:MAG: DUF2975 domain-containing protein [Spirochaetia bacterium]|nr:DUF2975 domain-containing protein [Spirochaetia bacterium]
MMKLKIKYLGNKSLSSVMYGFLVFAHYGMIPASIAVLCILWFAILPNPISSPGDSFLTELQYMIQTEMYNDMTKKEIEEFREMQSMHPAVRSIVILYVSVLSILIFFIIGEAKKLFFNFKKNIVFNDINVKHLIRLSKIQIALSIFTFDILAFIFSIILLILSAVFKSGAELQEEHDLTV